MSDEFSGKLEDRFSGALDELRRKNDERFEEAEKRLGLRDDSPEKDSGDFERIDHDDSEEESKVGRYRTRKRERKARRKKLIKEYHNRNKKESDYQIIVEEIKLEKSLQREGMGRFSRISIGFYEITVSLAKLFRLRLSNHTTIPLIERQTNMDILAEKIGIKDRAAKDLMRGYRKDRTRRKSFSLAEKLETFGGHYLKRHEVGEMSDYQLHRFALEYDAKGIVPVPQERVEDFVFRANTLLFIHNMMKRFKRGLEINFDSETFDVDLDFGYKDAQLIPQIDIDEANKRIPFHMDLSWVCGFVDGKSPILSSAYGVCFTSPKYNGFNFLMMRDRYKSREQYLRVLSHEMTHMGTVYFDDSPDLLETKAYTAGSASFGEYTIALNQRPNLFLSILRNVTDTFTAGMIPDAVYIPLPKVYSAIKIAERKHEFENARKRLQRIYGQEKGDYIAGRLSFEEVQEVSYTNDVRLKLDSKRGLKWRIMRENISRLGS